MKEAELILKRLENKDNLCVLAEADLIDFALGYSENQMLITKSGELVCLI